MDVYTRILQFSRLVKKSPVNVGSRTAVNLSYTIVTRPDNDPPDEKPPLIICHGLLGTKKNWTYLAKTIHAVTKRIVVRIDLRNHGLSPQTKSHKYEELAEDVLQLMTKLEIDNASLIGHNMGGRTAMSVALMKPSAVASLIVLEMSPASTSAEFTTLFPRIMEAMTAVKLKEKRKVHKARKEVKEQLKNAITNEVIMANVLTNVNVKQDGTIGWTCNLETLMRHFKYISSFPFSLDKGKKYFGPTLFIGGQLSEYIPADDLPRIRELFPKAVVKFVPGAGHFVHRDEPKAVLELVIGFLNDHSE
ncbi:protein ABHD11-like [Leguminivora glycinivorella]|uniref:protein ABHD11-like n=1 Tax=Leguminivora glycinivorella TaxID=1035111 RepID=UPI00200C54BD|nr:protein ABHD11-like [Leguminivora glycinivorella]